MLVAFGLVAVGLGLLLGGGELLVRGAIGLALRWRVPLLVISVSFVAIGTSIPELAVAVQAAMAEHADIAVGNVVGSNIANILLVLGVVALVRPLPIAGAGAKRDGLAMLGASVAFVLAAWWEYLGRGAGAVFVLLGAGYLAYVFLRTPSDFTSDAPEMEGLPYGVGGALLGLGVGLLGVFFGTRLLLDGAQTLALAAGISEAVIGLSLVAVGTSLPELVIGLMALRRAQTALTVGNVLGSNISNVFWILGIAALVAPFSLAGFLGDGLVMLGVAGLGLVLVWRERELARWQGLCFLVAYGAWMFWIYESGGGA